LKDLVKSHRDFLQYHSDSKLDWDGMVNSKNILEFDEAAIVGKNKDGNFLHHPSVDDYYTKSSAIRVSGLIELPTLALCAEDDPVCAIEGGPSDLKQVGSGLVVLTSKHGGHIGFARGLLGSSFWCDSLAAEWVAAMRR